MPDVGADGLAFLSGPSFAREVASGLLTDVGLAGVGDLVLTCTGDLSQPDAWQEGGRGPPNPLAYLASHRSLDEASPRAPPTTFHGILGWTCRSPASSRRTCASTTPLDGAEPELPVQQWEGPRQRVAGLRIATTYPVGPTLWHVGCYWVDGRRLTADARSSN